MIFVQLAYAGMALFSKAAVAKGMNAYVFVAYRQVFATIALAPFAFFIDRFIFRKIFTLIKLVCSHLLMDYLYNWQEEG